jgi:hypothetical protein
LLLTIIRVAPSAGDSCVQFKCSHVCPFTALSFTPVDQIAFFFDPCAAVITDRSDGCMGMYDSINEIFDQNLLLIRSALLRRHQIMDTRDQLASRVSGV